MRQCLIFLLLILLQLSGCKFTKDKAPLTLLVGTYTDSPEQGISVYRFDENTLDYTLLSTAPVVNPSFLTLSSDNKWVYAISAQDSINAKVISFRFDISTASLMPVNSKSTYGGYPCHINNDDTRIYIANYGSGSLCYYHKSSDGSIGQLIDVIDFNDPANNIANNAVNVQAGATSGIPAAHAHCVYFSPDSSQVFVNNLGHDRIHCFDRSNDPSVLRLTPGKQSSLSVAPGNGPRHSVFSKDGSKMYLINEISGKVDVFDYKDQILSMVQSVACDSVGGHGSADIHISHDGRFLYASNRLKADGISVFNVNDNGMLTKVGYQKTGIHPRNFILTPNDKYILVACRDNDQIEIYSRNSKTGLLKDTGKLIKLHKPVCLKWAY